MKLVLQKSFYAPNFAKFCTKVLSVLKRLQFYIFFTENRESEKVDGCYTMITYMEDTQWPDCIKNFDTVQKNIAGFPNLYFSIREF